MPQSQMKLDTKLPSLAAATEWLNRATAEPRETETKGHPTLVHFWSLSSETAKTNLAQVAQLRDQRKREGVRVVVRPSGTEPKLKSYIEVRCGAAGAITDLDSVRDRARALQDELVAVAGQW